MSIVSGVMTAGWFSVCANIAMFKSNFLYLICLPELIETFYVVEINSAWSDSYFYIN